MFDEAGVGSSRISVIISIEVVVSNSANSGKAPAAVRDGAVLLIERCPAYVTLQRRTPSRKSPFKFSHTRPLVKLFPVRESLDKRLRQRFKMKQRFSSLDVKVRKALEDRVFEMWDGMLRILTKRFYYTRS